jgi:hypothetical protein
MYRPVRFIFASVITLFIAAGSGVLILSAARAHLHGRHALTFTKGDPDEDAVGPNEERLPEDTVEGLEAELRAYPATPDTVPLDATLNAQSAFASIKARSGAAGVWQLAGPSKATYPGLLNFLGDHDQYVASGRVTALAIGPTCTPANCTLYLGAAGGGLWRTTKALSGADPNWQFISSSFATNAIGVITVDPNDASGRTVYAGTGEANASGDSEAGMGIYKSTDGGDTWTQLPESVSLASNFQGRSISSIVIAPNGDILVGIARGVRGYAGNTGGATTNPPPTTVPAPFGLYRLTKTNGGASFTRIWDGAGSVRGVNHVELDPNNPATIYAAAFQVGVWRSTNDGASFTQIKTPLNPANNTDRAEFAVAALTNGKTRMYVGVGNSSDAPPNRARFFRTEDAAGAAVFTDMTTPQNIGYCTAQCWYDNFVVSPAGFPDIVYLGGSFSYGQLGAESNGRAVLLSSDGGVTFNDETQDGDPNQAEALHPDQHALVVNPNSPIQYFEGSDGGVVRVDSFANVAYKCDSRGLNAADTALCKSLLLRVPDSIVHLNTGLSTLQFNSISVSAQRPKNNAQAGTQDNGTFQYTGSPTVWFQEIYGDGGQSGFNVLDDSLRFNTFFGQASDVNFHNGDPTKWVVATGPIVSSPEGSNFYPPIIADPNPSRAGSIFQGSQSVWRTQDWGGDQAFLEANCPEFTTSAANPACGNFVRIGAAGATDLSSTFYGADRTSPTAPFVSRIARAPSNTSTLWASTNGGRLFISDNGDAAPASVVWNRLDPSSAADPARFISGISVDPANPNRAFVSYSGYNINTPAQPGHVFEVVRTGPAATWTNLDGGTGPLGDLPVTDLVFDAPTNTLYAATDFAVLKKALPAGAWVVAGTGMPQVEVAGLTVVSSERMLYAATHGRSIWMLKLP